MESYEEIAEAITYTPPTDVVVQDYEWVPPLTGPQLEFYNSTALYSLAYGPRFSGKTYVAGHICIKHAWEQWNALVTLIVSVRRQGTDGGIFQTIVNELIPQWCENQPGFESGEAKQDPASKDLYVFVKNKYGGFSQIKLLSIPHGNSLAERVRGTAPSLVYIDEANKVDGEGFFTELSQQVGRRPHIPFASQRWVATCNPEGPSHWLHRRFFVDNRNADGSTNPEYSVTFLDLMGNPDPRAQLYIRRVIESTKHDPVEYKRLVLGEWIDRPSGDAIFAAYFSKPIHVRGDIATRSFLIPKTRLPITIGFDLGDVHHGIIFLQSRPTEDREVWLAFDEITVNQSGVSFDILVPALLDKMQYWCEACQYDFTFQCVSDNSAFSRFRAASGSFDHLQIERLSREMLAETPERWPNVHKPVRMIACPKPPGSVAGRIKTLMNLLSREEIFFSAKCTRLIEAIANLESEKDEPFTPSRKGDHIHAFDALTYPLFYHNLTRPRTPANTSVPTIRQMGGN